MPQEAKCVNNTYSFSFSVKPSTIDNLTTSSIRDNKPLSRLSTQIARVIVVFCGSNTNATVAGAVRKELQSASEWIFVSVVGKEQRECTRIRCLTGHAAIIR